MTGDAANERFIINNHALAATTPRGDCALFERFLRVGHDQRRIENQFLAQSMTDRARAKRGIEREMFWRGPVVTFASARAIHSVRMQRFRPGFAGNWRRLLV